MSTHTNEPRSTAPPFPDAYPVGPHLVVDRSEWVPGSNPESHLREDGQEGYLEPYYHCLKCGEQRLSKRDFPEACTAERAGGR